MSVKFLQRCFVFSSLSLVLAGAVVAQSTRPRRVKPKTEPQHSATASKQDSLLLPQPTPTPSARNTNVPLLDVKPVKPIADSSAPVGVDTGDTTHAYTLFQQKQYAAAAKEAKTIIRSDSKNAEAWKIAGFSELALKQYAEAAKDLQTALDLQEVDKEDDVPTVDALAQAYVLSENFEKSLPLLVKATSRKGAPDPLLLQYRGLAEYKTGKVADAERTFNEVVKANPKDANSLYYLGQIALARNDPGAAIAALNRATVNDPRLSAAWLQLTSAYLRRAAGATDQAQADADYLSAVRAGEGLIKVRTDADAVMLFGQALIGARQYPRAVAALERVTTTSDANSVTFYLLGVAQSRVKNFPKAIAALERAAEKKPDDVNVYRELGYAYEVSKMYAKALGAYQKGLNLVPGDQDFKESVDRVKPFAK
jgi:tetratricopeptide (TPR) repeat protein